MARVDSIFAAFTTPGSPGCAVGVSRNDTTVLARAYGIADLEREVPLTPTTIFEAGSISKQFTAAAVLLLAQDGKLLLAFVGTYRSDEADGTHTFGVDGGRLILDDGVYTRIPLQQLYRDAFRGQGAIIRFSRDGSGRVTGYGVWVQRARDVRFTRIGGS